ncbi:MAG: TrfA family protein [Nitrosospira sp.]|nr:TrfA family protein [Nitrosospira sp.]
MKKKEELVATVTRIRERRASAEIFQLPLWPETRRGTPNSFLRSALFAAIQGKDRAWLEESVLASQNGITVKFTGKQLNQDDLTVWETLVHLGREHPLGTVCDFTASCLLKSMKIGTGKSQYKQLHSTIVRLAACLVEVTHEGRTYMGHLIESGAKEESTKHYKIEINKSMSQIFGDAQWTALDWEQRLSLRNMPLAQAQALHAHYSTHSKPFPYKIETLAAYVG